MLVACGETSLDRSSATSGGTGGELAGGTGATAAQTGGTRPTGGASTGGLRGDGTGGAETGGSVTDPATGGGEIGGAETGGSATGGDGSGGTLVGLAFDIQVPLDENDYDWCAGECEPATVLVTEATDDHLDAVWGSLGRAQSIVLTPSENGWMLSDTLLLGTERTWEYAMCANESNLGPATFAFTDLDGDGALDLSITAEQNSRYCSDDYSTTSQEEVLLTGSPDDRLPEPVVGVTLLRGVAIDLDKPLVGTATCTLIPEGTGDRVPLTPRVMEGYVVGFDTALTLPIAVRYTTEFVGEDFAGVGPPANLVVATTDDFGVLTDGSFESGSADGVIGAEIVDSFGVAPIDGQYMLHANPGENVALRLQRTADEQSLALDARALDHCGFGGYGSLQISVAVVGNATTASGVVGLGETTPVTMDEMTIGIGELQHLVIPLPGAGTDVLVEFRGANYAGAGCNRIGVLIDDVRLE